MHILVPATTANLGPGFDTLGLALDLYNSFDVKLAETDIQTFSVDSQASLAGLSTEPKDSLFFKTLDQFYARIGQPRPSVSVEITANIPLVRGLGSSSSVIVGALKAGLSLTGVPISPADLLGLAMDIEGHPDNVAPAIFQGVQLCDGAVNYSLPWPQIWHVAIWVPPYPLETRTARAVIPRQFELRDAIFNLRKTSLLVHALHTADPLVFQAALQDRLHQPYRKALIPEWEAVEAIVNRHNGFGLTISGAGPSLAIYYHQDNTTLIAALQDWCQQNSHPQGIYQIMPLAVLASNPSR